MKKQYDVCYRVKRNNITYNMMIVVDDVEGHEQANMLAKCLLDEKTEIIMTDVREVK